MVGLGLTLTLDLSSSKVSSGYSSGKCVTGKSFYKRSDLTKIEKEQFSSNASGYEIIGTSGVKYRLILDYRVNGASRDRLQTRTFISSDNFPSPLKLKLLINSAIVSQSDISSNTPYYYFAKEFPLEAKKIAYAASLYIGENCEFSSDELVSIDELYEYGQKVDNWPENADILANFKNQNISLVTGENLVSFDDWTYLAGLIDRGIEINYFSPRANKWLKMSKKNAIAYPGRIYKLKNSSSSTLTFKTPSFRVPDDLNSQALEQGWNLMNLKGQSPNDNKFYLNPDPINLISEKQKTLSELISSKLITAIFKQDNDNQDNVSLEESQTKIKQGKYWLKLTSEADTSFKMPNLILNIEGSGNSFSSNQVPLKLTVENKDSASHFVVSSDVLDPCQIGIKVKDNRGKIVYDSFSSRVCPLWPNMEELKVNEKKEYNYLWEAPKGIKGDYTLEAYFNYSRLPGNKIIKKSSLTFK